MTMGDMKKPSDSAGVRDRAEVERLRGDRVALDSVIAARDAEVERLEELVGTMHTARAERDAEASVVERERDELHAEVEQLKVELAETAQALVRAESRADDHKCP
jgi:uncharacterized protein YPO0396